LFSMKWRVKAFFDVLHLHAKVPVLVKTMSDSGLVKKSLSDGEALVSPYESTGLVKMKSMGFMSDGEVVASPQDRLGMVKMKGSKEFNQNVYMKIKTLDDSEVMESPREKDFNQDMDAMFTKTYKSTKFMDDSAVNQDTGYLTYDTEMSDGERERMMSNLRSPQDVSEEETLDIFLFGFGPVVFWGFNDEREELDILKDLENFVDGTKHDEKAADDAMEEMEFTYRELSHVVNDIIELSGHKSGEKLAVSSAIAQSCHLSVHEWRLGQTISRNSRIPKELAETGMIHMSGDQISREIGRLFVERNLINLEPELLE
jgi:uncharacterized Rmd1/YagE family protein